MKARQCDACKECFPDEETQKQLYIVTKHDKIRYYGKKSMQDLCPKCYKKFLDVLGVSEEEGYSRITSTLAQRRKDSRQNAKESI